MNIFILIHSLGIGGTEKTALNAFYFLKKFGHQCLLIAKTKTPISYDFNSSEYTEFISKNIYLYIKQLRKLILIKKPDLLFVSNVTQLFYVFIATRFLYTKPKIIGTERSNPYKSNVGIIKKILKFVLSLYCDGFIFQTKRASFFYPKKIQKKSVIISNAVNKSVMQNLLFSERENQILYVGRLIKSKNVSFLIESFKVFSEIYPEFSFIIIGDGDQKQNLIDLSKSLKIINKIKFLGSVKDLYNYYRQSKFFWFSSLHEGMPNSLIEAMSYGIVCISFDCPFGPKELIQNNFNGFLINELNQTFFVNTTIESLKDLNSWTRISNNAFKINTDLESSKIYKLYEKYFYKIIS